MKEKLVIKNFGPIRDAEIELKKVNLFIGPQGSGKSTIAKVISAVMSDVKNRESGSTDTDLKTKLMEDLNLSSCFEQHTSIVIKSVKGDESLIDVAENVFVVAEPAVVYNRVSNSMYIPAERTLIPLINEASFFFMRENTPIPKYVSDFGLLFQKARAEIKSQKFNFLGEITYHYRDGLDTIELKNGKVIRLSESSNGIQTTVPLLIALSWLTSKVHNRSGDKNIYVSIEEPELSLFPITQNDLLKFIFERIASLDYHLTITTHSPYTLTAINNLLYAYQVGAQNEEVKDIVPQELWLNPTDVGAWYVENGTARSIIDQETNLIKAEKIDGISEVLNAEYDKIMDVKFK
jgi:predicted ATPase